MLLFRIFLANPFIIKFWFKKFKLFLKFVTFKIELICTIIKMLAAVIIYK